MKFSGMMDTLIVPAKKDGFEAVFIGKRCWYPVRLSSDRVETLKYVAAYQSAPISAITHIAEIDKIIPIDNENKYKIVFLKKPESINPIPYGDAPKAAMMVPRYTTFEKLKQAKTLGDLLS